MRAVLIGTVLLTTAAAPVPQQATAPGQRPQMVVKQAPDCPTVMMAADAMGQPVTAATAVAAAPALAVGKIVRADLPAAAVRYAVAPGHAPAAGTRGGVLAVTVDRPGRYRVEVGGGLWIDVVRGTDAVGSVAHGHGDPCSRFKKWVEFDLTPGRYAVQLSGSTTSMTWVAVTRRP